MEILVVGGRLSWMNLEVSNLGDSVIIFFFPCTGGEGGTSPINIRKSV